MTRRRTILHVATRYLRAGSERNLLHTMSWEQEAGFDVELATSCDSNVQDLDGRFRTHLIEGLQRAPHPTRDLAALRGLRRLIAERAYDIVHTHQSKAGILGRAAAHGRTNRVVHTVHMASFGQGYPRLAAAGYRLAERAASRTTTVTVFVGEELRRLYLDAGVCREAKTMLIRSPIDVERLLSTRGWPVDERAAVRRKYGIPSGSKIVLWMGALSPRKRPLLAVHSLRDLLAGGDTTLVIAGEGPEQPAIEAAAAAQRPEGTVLLLDHVHDPVPLVGSADVLVHTSLVEGVPQVVIQALAAARPVVATDVIGLREIAGAPIDIIERDGAGMAAAVRKALGRVPAPLVEHALEPWTVAAVDRQLTKLHARLA